MEHSSTSLMVPRSAELILCPIFAIFSCIAIFIMYDSIKHLYFKYNINDENELKNPIRYITIIGIITYLLSVLISFIWTILCVIESNTSMGKNEMILIGTILSLLGRWCMLLLFVMRIDYTFRDSIFEYSPFIIITLYLSVGALFILIIILSIFGYSNNLIISSNISYNIRLYGLIIFIIIEFILSILLIILFLQKLFNLFVKRIKSTISDKEMNTPPSSNVSISTTSSPTPNNNNTSYHIEDTMRFQQAVHENTLNAMTKYSLLVIIINNVINH